MITKLLIFRHGETDWNREGRFQGHLDVPINETGRAQARRLIAGLGGYGVQAILSSDLMRAYETARIVAEGLAVPVFIDPGLREGNLGEAQGLVREEIERRFGAGLVAKWRSNDPADAEAFYPGGESANQILRRVFAAIEGFLRARPYERIAVSTHGGVIRRLIHRVHPEAREVAIPNGVHYLLSYDGVTGSWALQGQGGSK